MVQLALLLSALLPIAFRVQAPHCVLVARQVGIMALNRLVKSRYSVFPLQMRVLLPWSDMSRPEVLGLKPMIAFLVQMFMAVTSTA